MENNTLLYKYVGHLKNEEFIKIIENIINNKSLKITNPLDFNDPFDCNIPYIYTNSKWFENLINKEFEKLIKEEAKKENKVIRKKQITSLIKSMKSELNDLSNIINSELDKLSLDWKNLINEYRILSLSLESENILMWSHYANSHKGLALGFKYNSENSIFKNCKEVSYSFEELSKEIFKKNIVDLIPQFLKDKDDEKITNSFANSFLQELINFFYIKKEDWEYENEVRLVLSKDDKNINSENAIDLINFGENELSEVIFGLLMEKEDEEYIIELIKKSFPNKRIEFKKVHKVFNTLEIRDYDNKFM